MNTTTDERFVTVGEAAEKVGMQEKRLRARCHAAGILVRWGGGEKRDFVKVRLSEVWRVLSGDRLPPPPAGETAPHKARATRRPLHRDVRC